MPGAFVAIEARIATAMGRLCNASATLGADTADVILSARDGASFDAAIDTAAVMYCQSVQFPTLARGDAITIDGVAWRVVDAPLHEHGMKRAALARA